MFPKNKIYMQSFARIPLLFDLLSFQKNPISLHSFLLPDLFGQYAIQFSHFVKGFFYLRIHFWKLKIKLDRLTLIWGQFLVLLDTKPTKEMSPDHLQKWNSAECFLMPVGPEFWFICYSCALWILFISWYIQRLNIKPFWYWKIS